MEGEGRMRDNCQTLESRVLLSAVSGQLTYLRNQLRDDIYVWQRNISASQQAVAADRAALAHGAPWAIKQLKDDLFNFARAFAADQQSMIAARAADLSALRADRGNVNVLAADRQKLEVDSASSLARLKQDLADRKATIIQDRAAMQASRGSFATNLHQDLALLANSMAEARMIIAGDLSLLRNPPTGSGGGFFFVDSSDVTTSPVSNTG